MKASEKTTVRSVEWTLESPGKLQRSVTTLPQPAVGEVLVASQLGAISPGTERTLLHGSMPRVLDTDYPYQPGRLNVVEIIDASDRTLVGERGIVVLGHRDFALVPYSRFLRLPGGVSDEEALLGGLASDASHAVETAAVEGGENCLVLGGGILGTLTAWELTLRTEGLIELVETDERRRDLLSAIAWPASVRLTDVAEGSAFHTVFECAGTGAAFEEGQARARPKGSLVIVSNGAFETYRLTADFFAKGLFLAKTDFHPDLYGFLSEYFARDHDVESLAAAAFAEDVAFGDFPRAYLESLLALPGDRAGLLPRVTYG